MSSSSRPNSGLFKIPIFPPLPFTFDAPPIVIIPPGSDPGSLNPDLDNGGNVLDKPSVLDIDPCVVAWRGSDSKRVDLTADEHAGIILSEPATMVSTASYPPTSSQGVATVNDVICNSDKAIEIHMEVNMHLKNAQNLTVNRESEEKNPDLENVTRIVSTLIEHETPLFVANGTIDEDSEKNKQDLLLKEAADKSLFVGEYPKSLFVCNIPEPGIEYNKIATVEVDESLLKNLTSVQTFKSVNQSNWCDICKVSCNGDKSFDSHIAGKQHQKNLKISEKTPTPPQTTLTTSMDTTPITKSMQESKSVSGNGKTIWCKICEVSCSTNLYDKHVLGKKHIKKLQKLEIIPNVPSTVADSVAEAAPLAEKMKLPESMNEEGGIVSLEASKRKADGPLSSDEDTDTKRQKMDEEEACDVLVICKVCNVSFDSLREFRTHLATH